MQNASRVRGIRFLYWIAIIWTLLVPVCISIFLERAAASWIALVSGAFVVFVSRLEDVAELSLGPLRAKLHAKIEEANATIEQLRHVALTAAEATLTDLMAGSFAGGITGAKRFEVHDKVIASLQQIGADVAQIEEAKSDWNKGISLIYHRAIKDAVGRRIEPSKINPAATDEMRQAEKKLQDLLDFENWTVPTPSQIQEIVEELDVGSEEVSEWIDDFRHFLKTGEIRRRDEFVKH